MRNNIPQIATPISHQFENEYYGKEISDVSDCLEVRERSLDSECENQLLFHIDIDLTHKWDENLREYLKNSLRKKTDLKLVTMQATRCCHGENIINGIFQLDGKIYSRQEIIDTSFGMDFDGFDRTIDTHIANLRKKLRIADNHYEYIESVYGLGYRVIDEE